MLARAPRPQSSARPLASTSPLVGVRSTAQSCGRSPQSWSAATMITQTSCTTVESRCVSMRSRSWIEACMCKTGKCVAVWGDRLEVGRLEEICAWPLVAVRVTPGGTHQFARLSSDSDKDGQAALVGGEDARLVEDGEGLRCRDRRRRRGLLKFHLECPHAHCRHPLFFGAAARKASCKSKGSTK